jgi:agmatinase
MAAETRDAIEAAARRILGSGRRPLVVGGDHSITYPVIRAVRSQHPKLGILHLDAHGDLYDEFQGDRFSHACPFARIMQEGLADRLVQVGVRTLNRHQREQAQRFGVETIEMKDWGSGRSMKFDEPVYISFDLDVIEPGLAPGVSHREPGGLTIRQAIDIIHSLRGAVVGADFVEFNPLADTTGLTASVSAKLVKELAGRMLMENS